MPLVWTAAGVALPLVFVFVFGVMLGKLLDESGAALLLRLVL